LAEKNKKSWFSFKKKLTKTEKKERSKAVRNTIIIFAIIIIFVGIAVGFVFLERFVKKQINFGSQTLGLELTYVPDWVSPELQQKILTTAGKGGVIFALNETMARQVSENLQTFSWLNDVKVTIGSKSIIVKASYRKPIALINAEDGQYYIDSQLVVLDFVPISKLPIVEITGVPTNQLSPRSIGTKWQSEDVAAAVELIELLDKMDKQVEPKKPLLAEIKSIDMSNFNGRRTASQPHIVFYAKDGTEIKWGAKKGDWSRNLEARDEEKLTILYNTYKELGTIQIRAAQKGSFIDLTKPQTLSLPIDKYKQ
jgi:hypothetical protein